MLDETNKVLEVLKKFGIQCQCDNDEDGNDRILFQITGKYKNLLNYILIFQPADNDNVYFSMFCYLLNVNKDEVDALQQILQLLNEYNKKYTYTFFLNDKGSIMLSDHSYVHIGSCQKLALHRVLGMFDVANEIFPQVIQWAK